MNKLLLTGFILLIISFVQAKVHVGELTLEQLSNPLGIDKNQPLFSWKLFSDDRNVLQTAYEIKVALNETDLINKEKFLWKSGKVSSEQSINIPYAGLALKSSQRYFWQVRVWDNKNNVSEWSSVAFWQMSLLNISDWKAQWIEPGYEEPLIYRPSPIFRKVFNSKKDLQSAIVYITAHGLYEAMINENRVGNDYLAPGWSSYTKHLYYRMYDVTDLIKKGDNAIGVTLGSGWYRGIIGGTENNRYGKNVSLLFQLELTFKDGTKQSILSDDTWKTSTGSIIDAEIYNGETIDANKEKIGWLTSEFNDKNWAYAKVASYNNNILKAAYNEPIRKHEIFKPVKVLITPKREKVIDFGQNLVGWEIVKLNGKAGDTVKIYHAEVLDKEGNFYTSNLGNAKATSTYILSGKNDEIFEPHFTFYGFRYIKIIGLNNDIIPGNFKAVALYSDMTKTGNLITSDSLINQLQHNILWGMQGNFLDIPTDCPQRAERLGWTGDAQVFSRTATFNRGVEKFFDKWLSDLAADQFPNGAVPHVIPNIPGNNDAGATGWADAAVIVPWNIYMAYGDKKLLERQYPSMKAWVDYMKNKSINGLWNTGAHFGDWLAYIDNDPAGRSAVTDKYLLAQCFFANSTQLLINTAKILGKNKDVLKYSKLIIDVKNAFMNAYVTPNGNIISGTQTAYAISLNFDMLPERFKIQTAEKLVENIKTYNYHLTTGFLGASFLLEVLTRFGYDDIAYKLLLQEKYPSWLYPVKMGATTIWERWNGIKPDSTFEDPGMNSFNHYAYGAVGDWMYRRMAGIMETTPGYKEIAIQPHIGGNFTFVKADIDTYYGIVSSHWKIENGILQMHVEIPANTKATIYIPAVSKNKIYETGTLVSEINGIKILGRKNGYEVLQTGSGKYDFSIKQ